MSLTQPRIGHLVSQYPAYSHGFIDTEIQALRAAGAYVLPLSVNRVGIPQHPDSSVTRSFKGENFFSVLLCVALLLVIHPKRFARALRYQLSRRMFRTQNTRTAFRDLVYVCEAMWFLRIIQRNDISHLHVHFANAAADVGRLISILDSSAKRSPKLTWSLAVHGPTDFEESGSNDLVGKVIDARFVTCISDYAQRTLVSLLKDERSVVNLNIVRMGVSLRAIALPSFHPKASGDSSYRVLFVGRLVAKKGILDLIDVCRDINSSLEVPGQLELMVVGDGPERSLVERVTDSLPWVEIKGAASHDEVFEWYKWADTLCLPSYSEGLPVVLMEAMAHGLPVISTSIAGIPELISDGESGLLVQPGDHSALRFALLELMKSPELRRKLGAQGRRVVEERFDARLNASQLLELIVHSS